MTCFKLTYNPDISYTLFLTTSELLIGILSSIRLFMASFISIICLHISFSYSFASLAFSGSFFDSQTKSRTNYTVTLNRLAISTYEIYFFMYSSTIYSYSSIVKNFLRLGLYYRQGTISCDIYLQTSISYYPNGSLDTTERVNP